MRKTVAVACAVVALLGACSTKKTGTNADEKKGPIFEVSVDHHDPDLATAILEFFPKELKAHPGDTIRFNESWSGEPHTVAFGTVIDDVAKAVEKLGPNASDEQYFSLKELAVVPGFFPFGPNAPKTDPPQPIQRGAQPCFLDTAPTEPSNDPCPKADQKPFKGQAIYNSGFLKENATFDVPLDASLAPGTYTWWCLVHQGEMTGKLTVVASTETIPTPKEVAAERDKEIAEKVGKFKAAVDAIKQTPGQVTAGATIEDVSGVAGVFSPKKISVPVGGSVSWVMDDTHSVSFNPSQDAPPIIKAGSNGMVEFNYTGINPAGGPGFPSPFAEGSDTKVFDGGTWDGQGFRSSGLANGEPGVTFKLAFSKAGTYQYQCLLHPDMEGSVVVG